MSRKRAEKKSKKTVKNSFKKNKNKVIAILILVLFFFASVWLVISSDTNNSKENSGKWLFALDNRDVYVSSNSEYNTGYIPTIVVIDKDGNIVKKLAGAQTKDTLLGLIDNAKISDNSRTNAPDFTLETLYGNKFTLSDYKGTPVILDLMAVRCPPCKQQMPELQKVKKELGDDVVILSIDVDAVAGTEGASDVINAFGEYIKEE